MQGKKIRCKSCQLVFVVQGSQAAPHYALGAPPTPPPAPQYAPPPAYQHGSLPEDYDDYTPDAKQKSKSQWNATRVGLLLYQIRYWLLLAFWISLGVVLGLSILGGATRSRGLAIVAAIVYIPAALGSIAAVILGMVGAPFCMQIPPKTGLRGLGIALTILEGSTILCALLYVVGALVQSIALVFIFMVLLALCSLAAVIVFMLFVRAIAVRKKMRGAASQAVTLLVLYLATPFGYGALVGIAFAIGMAGVPILTLILFILFTIIFFAVYAYVHIGIVSLISSVRASI